MVKKPYTSKVKTYISYHFFLLSFTFTISPTPRDSQSPKKKNSKRLTTCMISYLIIFVYAFNGCCLTDIYTKLYLEYYFRSLYNVYNMEVVHIKKKLIILFFYLSPMTNSYLHHCWPPLKKILESPVMPVLI